MGASLACTPFSDKNTADLSSQLLNKVDLPEDPPLHAQVFANEVQVGVAEAVAYEWPNQDYDDVNFWYADAGIHWPDPTPWSDGLTLRIPTFATPISTEYWIYKDRDSQSRMPIGPPLANDFCIQSENECVRQVYRDAIEFPLPSTDGTGIMVVQFEWMAPPSASQFPLVARVSWIIEFSNCGGFD